MTPAVKRVVLTGLLSHAFAFTTLFAILSAHIGPKGTGYIPAFLLTALALALLAYVSLITRRLKARKATLFLALVILVAGALGLRWIDDSKVLAPIVFFAPLALFLWRRNLQLLEDLQYVRRALFDQLRIDTGLLIAAAVTASAVGLDPAWQDKVLPLFTIFLLTRLIALSFASRLLRGESAKQAKSSSEKWQDNMAYIVIGGGLLGIWLLQVLGIPLVNALLRLLGFLFEPILYAISKLVGWIYGWVQSTGWYDVLAELRNKKKDGEMTSPEVDPLAGGPTGVLNTEIFYIFGLLILAFIVYLIIRRFQSGMRVAVDGGIVEMREFITADKPKRKAQPAAASGSLTRMRKAYRRFLLAMKKEGHLRSPSETASEFVDKIAARKPERQAEMDELTRLYMEERYGNKNAPHPDRADELSRKLSDSSKPKPK